ncbi:MAG TPA: GntR family transcriptional regulator, partial [Caproiciproducens sp.]|nr:GntR family transcriptional regulator [Caproiciproducens sp.]
MEFGEEKSIYLQIAEKIEDAILSGAFREEEQIPSTTEFSVNMKINPATA